MTDEYVPDGGTQRYFGLYPAIVTNLEDPDEPGTLGRIEVKFPWLGEQGEDDVRAWATMVTPYADKNQGFQFIPEKNSQVIVAFEAGVLNRPYIVGACWNGKETIPEKPKNKNNKRFIRTRSQSLLEFDDTEGKPKITLSTKAGHKLELDEASNTITVTHADGARITFTATGSIEIKANTTVDVQANVMNVKCPVANFDNVINCKTLVASSSIVSPSYTPGAGNTW